MKQHVPLAKGGAPQHFPFYLVSLELLHVLVTTITHSFHSPQKGDDPEFEKHEYNPQKTKQH